MEAIIFLYGNHEWRLTRTITNDAYICFLSNNFLQEHVLIDPYFIERLKSFKMDF
ncbi:hypothetical protein SAMN04488513_101447 [Pseudozobellia thermophila]|uniref:Uncharacterized protein n=1 Tax=Pseudozobellia thermophila TaxID=192903 RepID=A0A1M6BKD3_9FLAO|nr:hypothetical protein SAMN04488513_101447 [Pseudozobellia thermophila]